MLSPTLPGIKNSVLTHGEFTKFMYLPFSLEEKLESEDSFVFISLASNSVSDV